MKHFFVLILTLSISLSDALVQSKKEADLALQEYLLQKKMLKDILFGIVQEQRIDTLPQLLLECEEDALFDALFSGSYLASVATRKEREIFANDCKTEAKMLFQSLIREYGSTR